MPIFRCTACGWFVAVFALLLASAQQLRAEGDDEDAAPDIGRAVYVGDDLLRGYDPRPGLVTKQTHVATPAFPAIDIHCHWGLDVEPAFLLQKMDELGVERAINLSGGNGEKLEQMLARYHPAAPGRLVIFCSLSYAGIDEPGWGERQAEWLEEVHRKGVAGLKVFKSLGLTVKDGSGKLVPIDDPRLDPVWAKCGELGIPVLIHAADPKPFFEPVDEHNERWMQLQRHPDWSFHGPQFPTRDEVLAQRDRMVAKHPGTIFIGAHLGENGEDLAKLAERLDRLPNLVVDISGRVSELGRQPYSARRFIIKYQDRVLFGTDRYPGQPVQPRYQIYYRFLESDDEYFDYYQHPFPPSGDWKIYGVFLPREVLEKVYRTNAERVLGLSGARP